MNVTIFLIFISFGIAIFLLIVFAVTYEQKKKSKQILSLLKEEELRHLKVHFTQIKVSKFTYVGGIQITVDLFYNENMVLICPNLEGFLNGLHNINLPIIITYETESYEKLLNGYNVIKPIEFSISNDLLKIRYTKKRIIDENYDIEIKFMKKQELEEFNIHFKNEIK